MPYAHVMNEEEQKKIAAERIRNLRKQLGLKQVEFAEYLGLGPEGQSTVSKWEGAKQLPGAENSAKLAQRSGKSSVYFSGLEPISELGETGGRVFPLVGDIQAGTWKEAIEFAADDRELVQLPASIEVPPFIMKAFTVRGTSMDKEYPDGSVVFVADLFSNRITPLDGDIVMVQRQDKHGLYEATLKELVIDENGKKWLWPRSNDPEHQSPLSIDDGRDLSTDVVILGIVQAAIVVPRRRRRISR